MGLDNSIDSAQSNLSKFRLENSNFQFRFYLKLIKTEEMKINSLNLI